MNCLSVSDHFVGLALKGFNSIFQISHAATAPGCLSIYYCKSYKENRLFRLFILKLYIYKKVYL